MKTSYFAWLVFLFIFILSCTENPFFEEKRVISNDGSYITGKITLQGETDHSGIYIWVRGLGVSSFTGADGTFKLLLPAVASQPGKGLTGFYPVYFFMSNFRVDSVSLYIRNGLAEFPQAGFSKKGELLRTIDLAGLLTISVGVSPDLLISGDADSSFNEGTQTWQYTNHLDTIKIKTRFRFKAGSEDVRLNIPLNRSGQPAYQLLKKVDTGKIIQVLNTGFYQWGVFNGVEGDVIEFNSQAVFFEKAGGISATEPAEGFYHFLPALILTQTGLPTGLLQSLKPCLFENKATTRFADIPVRIVSEQVEFRQFKD